MVSLLLWLLGWGNGTVENFGDELAEIGRLGLVELSAAIFRGVVPNVRRRAHETADRVTIVELKEVHHNDFVDDGADFARHLGTLHLEAVLDEAIEVVDDSFEDDDEDHVLLAHML